MDAFILTGYTILAFVNRRSGVLASTPSFQPYAIRRESDGTVFSIGDEWYSSGGPCSTGQVPHGTITGFEMLEGNIYIQHDWSGVGFSLEGIEKGVTLPSKFQLNQVVIVDFGKNREDQHATIRSIHFLNSQVKYDLGLWLGDGSVDNPEKETRVYNVEEKYLRSA